jgi:hypothetical protein
MFGNFFGGGVCVGGGEVGEREEDKAGWRAVCGGWGGRREARGVLCVRAHPHARRPVVELALVEDGEQRVEDRAVGLEHLGGGVIGGGGEGDWEAGVGFVGMQCVIMRVD